MFRRVISQLAKFPTFKNVDAPNRIKRRSHRCCFSKGPKLQQMPANGSSHKERFSFFFFFFPCVFSPWSCLPISL